jgi:flavin-dependent dehydrogenase
MLDAAERPSAGSRNQSAAGSRNDSTECDVLVVGGGPAGSTVAARLAAMGRDVVVLEKAHHPRFHIGESLLPANLPVFEEMGLAEDIKRIGVYKPGAEFVSDLYGKSNLFYFVNASHLVAPHAYHVRRADFDQLLFEHCRKQGARAHEGVRVADVAWSDGERAHVTAIDDAGRTTTWRPRFVVDASGRDTLLANKLKMKDANKRNNTAAIFGHFTGIDRRGGEANGVITIHLVEGGWFWMIPLPDDVMSVGFVSGPSQFKERTGTVEDVFWSAVKAAPSVAERMQGARATGELIATGNYSYTSRVANGERFILIGDAFTFIDPIFSSGVMIAMTTGMMAASVIDVFLQDAARGRKALNRYERKVRRATAHLAWLIYRINDPVMRYMLMHPSNKFRMRDGLLALLAGQIFHQPLGLRRSMFVFKLIYHALRLSGPRAVAPREPAAA